MREIIEEEQSYFKPKTNYLPENFNIDEWIASQKLYGFKKFDKDFCAELLSTLYTIPVFNKDLRDDIERADGFTPLSSEILYSKNKEYKKYLNLFIDYGVLECNNSYSTASHKCKGYRFSEKYRNQPYQKYTNCKFGEQKNENNTLFSSQDNYSYPVSTTAIKLINTVSKLRVNYEYKTTLKNQLEEGKSTYHSYNCTDISLDMIYNQNFFAKQDRYGRIHTNLTNLNSKYRNYLTTDQGDRLVSIDIKNSQPFFTILLLNSSFWSGDNTSNPDLLTIKNIKNKTSETLQQPEHRQTIIMFTKSVEDNEDVLLYRKLVLDGCLYEFLLDKLQEAGIRCLNRGMAKDLVFLIFFSELFQLENSRPANVFKELFPSVYQLFAVIKKYNYAILSWLLQSIESHIFIEEVIQEFWLENGKVPVFTIHDCTVVPINKSITMKWNLLHCIKKKVGYQPTVSCEVYKPK